MLNALLARDPASRRRSLGLRTYAVIPLADDCGILQWVEHLVAFKVGGGFTVFSSACLGCGSFPGAGEDRGGWDSLFRCLFSAF